MNRGLDFLCDENASTNPNYAKLIDRQERRFDQSTRFNTSIYSDKWASILWQDEAKKTREFFRQRLAGKPLVDLGGGIGWMTGFANELRVGRYVNVDRNHHGELPSDPYALIEENSLATSIQADMLEFVSRIKDGTVNFTINGINGKTIDDPEYNNALAKEVLRATQANGLIFGIQSGVLSEISRILDQPNSPAREVNLQQETGFKIKTPLSQYVFEKNK